MASDGPRLPFPVEEIERAAAPEADVFLHRYVRPGRPVILTGVTGGWTPPAEWTFERMARRYGDARVVTAALAGDTLLVQLASLASTAWKRLRNIRRDEWS